MVRVMSKQERDEFRASSVFKRRNKAWNAGRFNAPQRVGKLSEIIAKASPECYDDFKLYYLQNFLDWEGVLEQAKELYEYLLAEGEKVTPAEALAQHIIHVFDQAWEGWERENRAWTKLEEITGKSFARPHWKWDCDYAIDLVLGDADSFEHAFQIKPASFFRSNQNSVARARKSNQMKAMKAWEKHGKNVWFVNADDLFSGKINLIHWKEIA